MTDPVRAQYEAYPYPARDPADERRRLIAGSPSHILEVNHYLFAGRRDFAQPFRALFAGGGTGDGAIMLAQQLADLGAPAELVHLDISAAAQRIAAARAEVRQLGNIRFVGGAIEEAGSLGLGRFDYIDCCGVLHHLDDPGRGLAALTQMLAPEGGIGLMVYGALGRIGVYHGQAMLRMLAEEGEPAAAGLDRARRLLRQLPKTNWLARNPFLGDHLSGGDAGLYDLLLHARDRAYRVPELAALIDAAGLRLVRLIEPARYDPARYLTDPRLLAAVDRLSMLERATFAELLAGDLKVHIAYAVPAGRRGEIEARPSPEMVPILREGDGAILAKGLKPGQPLTVSYGATTLTFPLGRYTLPILAQIDGRRSLAELRDAVAAAGLTLPEAEFAAEFAALFQAFNAANQMFLAERTLSLRG